MPTGAECKCAKTSARTHVDMKKILVFIFFAALVVLGSTLQKKSPPAPLDYEGYDIFIVAGQSNSVGVGFGRYHDEFSTPENDKRIFQLGRFGSSNMRVLPASDSLEHWSMEGRVGFGAAFARRYAAEYLSPIRKVLLIPAGRNGSYSFQWDMEPARSMEIKNDDSPSLLTDLLARIRAAKGLPGKNEIKGLLWHQGESDVQCLMSESWCHTATPDEAALAARLTKIFGIIRAEQPEKEFPIIMGKFVPAWDGDARPDLKARIEGVLVSLTQTLPLTGVVESEGLPANSQAGVGVDDPLHFSAQGQIDFGARYFEMYKKLKR